MGGSGDGGRNRISETELSKIRDEARQRLDRSRADAGINAYLQHELVGIMIGTLKATNLRLDGIETALEDEVEEFERRLFGGSVAKHTHVNGLSDVDCLIVFDADSVPGETPTAVLADLSVLLERKLDMSEVRDISVGEMSVTVTYRDDSQIQLLPTTDDGESQKIPSANGDSWTAIRPKLFAQAFSKANADHGGGGRTSRQAC
jgi:predicted nucleotidyltransferase